ncbi:DnaJ family domain-containing protein [Sporolactobacillus sp. Y61]|jgi:hypothetical protein|uniref:DnaJ family domain-containing protein n=1 Tax=Sporolactobacillus sp. Y61 TaxID=3160863 RepID=A0AAU8IFU9_9BACL|nr:DnaJ family domain-containing protein [Sporolactobacillus sp. THM19-2]RYL88874.1 DUF1992 domain-containing protein [Sporolactobacillus sp. THM19-2]
MSIIDILADEKIKQGMKDGAFDDLPGRGKPQKFEDLSSVPEDLRAGYHMLKNAGYLPEELQVKKEIVSLTDLIRCCTDEDERIRLNGELKIKKLRFNQLVEKRSIQKTRTYRKYRDRIFNKFHM